MAEAELERAAWRLFARGDNANINILMLDGEIAGCVVLVIAAGRWAALDETGKMIGIFEQRDYAVRAVEETVRCRPEKQRLRRIIRA